ncbi:MAG: lysophospholipid acyltransferase family protein [Candidatus Planktophila sp.]|jgi:1-acyl-sn-glycerol-3-phosphate acyltransferase|tara:strand:+ start:152 stop:937 length:786 start_codon:yes stop_codon:yes gene_type:complete
MAKMRVSYAPPTGYPLGTNRTFKICAGIVIPLIKLITKRTWVGAENIPKSGAVIVANNHLSYFDVLNFAHFLFENGRAPRFLGKVGVFRVPIIGRILLAAGQVPVERETPNASKAVDHAKLLLQSGHLLGVYPEGTLSRDLEHWPMIAKTGLVRLALSTNTPVIPVAQWGSQILMPTYSKKLRIFPRTQITIVAGKPVDLSKWAGKADDPQALIAATAAVMRDITTLLEGIRGEKRPEVIFDPHTSDLPRTGNFKKKSRRK